MTTDGFEATFRVRLPARDVWARLTGGRDDVSVGSSLWLPGFDSQAAVSAAEPSRSLQATKTDEPCSGTDIVVVLEDDASGTRVHVVQSGFGDWLADVRDLFAVGWRFIVADLHTFLATGVHARRHLRAWPDFGAPMATADGGVRVGPPTAEGVASRLGLEDGDLVVGVGGAPVASVEDLVTALRVIGDRPGAAGAEWIRSGALMSAAPTP